MSDCHFENINKLVSKAKDGDRGAIEELNDFYQPLIRAAIRKCICNDAALSKFKDDLISIACLEFTTLIMSYDISRSFFSYYVSNKLYPNLLKASKELLNKNSNNLSYEINFSDMPKLWDPESADPFAQIELEIIIKDALSQLKPEHRQAVEFIYFEQMTQEDAAAVLKLTQSAFSKRLNKALSKLKNILENNLI
jgi:RNA polymerase sigma-70 factor (ECF subfamily)